MNTKTTTKKSKVITKVSKAETLPDFTARAIESSNSKRILFLRAIGKMMNSLPKGGKTVTVKNLIGKEYVAGSLLHKVEKFYAEKIKIEATKHAEVGKKSAGVVEVKVSKA